MNFIEDVIQSIIDKRSVVCMGLDPRLDKEGEIPQFLIDELGVYLHPNTTSIWFGGDMKIFPEMILDLPQKPFIPR